MADLVDDSGESGLSEARRLLVDASVALAVGDWDALDRALADAVGTDVEESLEEILLQSYLILGYPRALTALEKWRSKSGRPPPPATRDDLDAWADRGAEVCGAVYGTAYEGLRRRMQGIHPDIERWMITEGYGKVLARPGATLIDRELAIVALLVGLGSPRQLHSHLRGALQVGAPRAVVAAVVTRAVKSVSRERAREAEAVWTRVLRRRIGAEAETEETR